MKSKKWITLAQPEDIQLHVFWRHSRTMVNYHTWVPQHTKKNCLKIMCSKPWQVVELKSPTSWIIQKNENSNMLLPGEWRARRRAANAKQENQGLWVTSRMENMNKSTIVSWCQWFSHESYLTCFFIWVPIFGWELCTQFLFAAGDCVWLKDRVCGTFSGPLSRYGL